MDFFEIEFLPEALEYLNEIPGKAKDKILFNMAMARSKKDPKLFKPLQNGIWYFRTQYFGNHYRIFAFWDSTQEKQTLIVGTHGYNKKSNKTPRKEINMAKQLRAKYYDN